MAILLLTEPVPAAYFGDEIRKLAPDISLASSLAEIDPQRVEAILAWKLDTGIASRLPNLKLVSSMGAGVDQIVSAADLPRSVPIVRIVDPRQAIAMAQYVLMMVLRQSRNLPAFEQQQARRVWQRRQPPQAFSETVAVLGLGSSGKAVARLLRSAGFNVVGWSRTAKDTDGVTCFTGADGLVACLEASTMAVCVLPATAATRGILNRTTLSHLRRGGYVINIARGAHVDEADLAALIREGHLSGAALDVQSQEPLPAEHFLWSVPNVTITPHSCAEPAASEVAAQFLAAFHAVKDGRAPDHVVDRDAGY